MEVLPHAAIALLHGRQYMSSLGLLRPSPGGATGAVVLNTASSPTLRHTVRLRCRSLFRSASSAGELLPVLLDQGFRSASTFVASLLVARAVEKEQYGLYTLLYTIWVSLFAFQAGLAGTPYIALSAARVGDEKKRYLGNILVLHLLVSGVAAVGMILFGMLPGYSRSGPSGAAVILAFSLCTIPVLLRDFLRQVLMADLRVWRNLAFGLPTNVMSIVLLLWLYRAGVLTVSFAYLVLGACSLFPSMILLYVERHSIGFSPKEFRSHVVQNWQMGKWLLAKALLTIASVPIYGWALAFFHGTASVALYGACVLPISFLSPLAQALCAFLTPKASHAVRQGTRTLRDLTIQSTVLTAAPLLGAAGLLLLFSKQVVTFLFQGKYVISPYLIFLFALQMTVLVASTCVCSSIVAVRRTDISFKGELVAAIVTICLGLPLIYGFGVWGVAIGLLVSCSGNMLYQWVEFFQRVARDDS